MKGISYSSCLTIFTILGVDCSQPRRVEEDQRKIECPLKALDFSLDNDDEPDENSSYTHATLQKENLPHSFTICTAFMVEAWLFSDDLHRVLILI